MAATAIVPLPRALLYGAACDEPIVRARRALAGRFAIAGHLGDRNLLFDDVSHLFVAPRPDA